MKVNDVLRKGEVAFRVLAMKDDICFCINCNTNFMPVWMPMSTLDEYTPDSAPMSDTNLTAKQKQVICFPHILSNMLFDDLFDAVDFTAQHSGANEAPNVFELSHVNSWHLLSSPFAEIESFSHPKKPARIS